MSTTDDTVDVAPFVEWHRAWEPSTETAPSETTTGPQSLTSMQAAVTKAQRARQTGRGIPEHLLSTQPEPHERADFDASQFWEDYIRRVKANQDLLILVSDYENDRGTGKTVLSIDLAETLDRTDDGLTPAKASIAPEQLINGYGAHAKGSSLVLDEAEAGVGSREAMTRINRMLSEIVSMGRVQEKYVILNMPASNHIDKNILDLAHYWILVKRKGLARVYKLKNNPFEQKKWPTPVQKLEWSDIDGNHPVYRSLTKEKLSRIDNPAGGGDGKGYVHYQDHVENLEQARSEAVKETRDEIITALLNHPEVHAPQRVIADAADVSQSYVSNLNTERP